MTGLNIEYLSGKLSVTYDGNTITETFTYKGEGLTLLDAERIALNLAEYIFRNNGIPTYTTPDPAATHRIYDPLNPTALTATTFAAFTATGYTGGSTEIENELDTISKEIFPYLLRFVRNLNRKSVSNGISEVKTKSREEILNTPYGISSFVY